MASRQRCLACKREHDGKQLQCAACQRGETVTKSSAEIRRHAPPRAAFPGRIEVTLPWTALAPDNQNSGVAGEENREKRAAFKAAKLRAIEVLGEAYDGEPFAGPARVVASFWFPDNRVRDPVNFAKGLLDALKGTVITDDRWQVLRSVTIEAAGVDADRPRCDLVIEAMLQAAS